MAPSKNPNPYVRGCRIDVSKRIEGTSEDLVNLAGDANTLVVAWYSVMREFPPEVQGVLRRLGKALGLTWSPLKSRASSLPSAVMAETLGIHRQTFLLESAPQPVLSLSRGEGLSVDGSP